MACSRPRFILAVALLAACSAGDNDDDTGNLTISTGATVSASTGTPTTDPSTGAPTGTSTTGDGTTTTGEPGTTVVPTTGEPDTSSTSSTSATTGDETGPICDPGMPNCVCDNGACIDGYVCQNDVCGVGLECPDDVEPPADAEAIAAALAGHGVAMGRRPLVDALLSRLLHQCHTIRIKGPSLRAPKGDPEARPQSAKSKSAAAPVEAPPAQPPTPEAGKLHSAVRQTEPVKLSPSTPAINEGIVNELIDVMGSEFTSLVKVYLEDTPKNLGILVSAAERGDVQAMIAPAHSLKSTSANLGAMALSDLAKLIEHGARAGTLRDSLGMARQAGTEFRRAAEELQRLRVAAQLEHHPRHHQHEL